MNFCLILSLSQILTYICDAQTVIITGGSQGMGLSVGKLLAKKGANVVIVARSVDKLKAALAEISVCQSRTLYLRFPSLL
jgi:3-dehydrosphinganine reductase